MAKRSSQPFRIGVVRMIGGNIYQGRTVDSKGRPLVYKTGPKTGQPRADYPVGIAVPKTKGHFSEEAGWGQTIWAEGHAAWPAGQAQKKDFAWKVIDGDSTEPNGEMRRPCDQPGYAGHWVLWFGGTTPPAVADGREMINGKPPVWSSEPNLIMAGDYVEVSGSVVGNEAESPGVYLNLEAICLRGYHPEGRMTARIDLASAGFGAPMPAGASAIPMGMALAALPPAPGAQPSTPVAPPAPVTPAPAPSAPPAPVTPNPAILGAPAPVVVPPAPVPSPAVPAAPAPVSAPRMLKNGGVYDDWIKAGWTDDSLRAAGHID